MERENLWQGGCRRVVWCTLATLLLLAAGCAIGPTSGSASKADRTIFELKAIAPERAMELLADLGFDEVSILTESNSIAVSGPADVQQKAAVVLDLIDAPVPYTIETLAPMSRARELPANEQFAAVLGNAAIGTFAEPPQRGRFSRAIIDIHDDSVIAIAPAPLCRDIVTLMTFGPTALQRVEERSEAEAVAHATVETTSAEGARPTTPAPEPEAAAEEILSAAVLPDQPEPTIPEIEPETVTAIEAEPIVPEGPTVVAQEDVSVAVPMPAEPPVSEHVRATPAATAEPVRTVRTYELAPLANGDDVLQLDLPDRLEMIQLLDLVAEYLQLDYLYDPEKIRGQTVSLRLHGKLQGEIHVKELYPLLESVLKFKGLAMTCHQGNLVTILPIDEALGADPTLLDGDRPTLGTGDLVVTRAFDLQYVNTASAVNLLDSMKLSVAVSPVAETRTLIVTCYAHRMERIERLLNMVDRPGRAREFRYRPLRYTLAASLAKKVETLVAELQTVPVKIAPVEKPTPSSPVLLTSGPSSRPPSSSRLSSGTTPASEEAEDRNTVYLDADERTNRLLMIGHAEQLAIVEDVIDALDVAQHDPRALKVYAIVHLPAAAVVTKLEELQVIGKAEKPAAAPPAVFVAKTSSSGAPATGETTSSGVVEATQVTVLEATNALLINGTAEQHARIGTVIDHIDVAPQDLRRLKVYDIRYVDAEDMRQKLIEFEVIGDKQKNTAEPVPASGKAGESALPSDTSLAKIATMQPAQMTVREATNSLLVNATEAQHTRIAEIITHLDVVQQDLRAMKVYDIQYVDASEVKDKLEEFELIGAQPETPGRITAAPAVAGAPRPASNPVAASEGATMQRPQVAVLESTNSLLINATEFQHVQMASVIKHVDKEVRQEAIPYEIYFLENQDPEALAEVLGKLVQETVTSKEAKIEQPVRRKEDEITIVPDKGTFSLVVYASRKNQEWISKLIEALDKRRPQVLIDVTLVEITETDQFTYDLNVIQSHPDLHRTSAISGVDPNSTSLGRLFQSGNGLFTGFYGDRHIQALLQAVQAKNYGRVLAKPKILVNDNEPGVIKTTDTTYVERRSSVPVTSGGAGSQQNLIQTSLDYTAYEAGITLNITPHISEGRLLRLDISLIRSDFLPTEDQTKPPNTTASEVTTAVTVPDGSTIILGGLLKLNQNKGGKKVPLLGDVPVVGGLFRSVNNSDKQSKLYVFVKAEIIRPTDALTQGLDGLEAISQRNRAAFEAHEAQFQAYQNWPGVRPQPVEPARVLDAK